MSQERVTRNEAAAVQLQVLRDRFFTARDRRSAETAGGELTRFASESCFDCESALTAMETAYTGILQGGVQRPAAVVILSGLEEYFQTSIITHKALLSPALPEPQAVQNGLATVNRIKSTINRIQNSGWYKSSGFAKTFPSIPTLQELLDLTYDHLYLLSQQPGKYPHPLVQIVAGEKHKRAANPAAFERVTEACGAFVTQTSRLLNRENTKPADLQAAFYQLLFTNRLTEHPTLPHPTSRRFGADGAQPVSLREIVSLPLTNSDLLGEKILNYLSHLPRGDVFWERVRTVFSLAAVLPPRGSAYTAEQTKFIQRIFVFQRWLGEKLILPALSELPLAASLPPDVGRAMVPDLAFDRMFARLISSLGPTAFELGYSIYQQAAFAASSRQRFTPGMSFAAASAESRLITFIQHLARQEMESRMMVNNREVHLLLGKSWSRLRVDWEKRFAHLLPHKRNLTLLVRGLESQVKRSLDRELSQSIMKYLETEMGGNFRQLLHEHGDQVRRVTGSILQEITHIDYWPHPDLVHTVVFTQQSLPELMGIAQVSFTVDEQFDRPIGFHFRLQNADFGISGELHPDNRFVFLLDETVFPKSVRTILEFLVAATIRDYLKRGEIMIRTRGTARSPHSSPTSDGGPHREQLRSLPRQQVRYGKEETVVVHQSEMTSLIETHSPNRGQFAPRQVGAHRRNYTQADEYAKAYAAWESAPPEEKLYKEQELIAARQNLRQPQGSKINATSLPARLRLEPLVHPRTGLQLTDILRSRRGQPMWRNTFVSAHMSPALTPDERENYALTYERRFRANGSALSFADSQLFPWMVGLYHEELGPAAPGL